MTIQKNRRQAGPRGEQSVVGKHAPTVEPSPGKTDAKETGEFTSYSIRLNDHQRDLLLQAAAMRGWSPTRLIRTAAVDKAIHIVNTGRLTKFNFKDLAAEIAKALFVRKIEFATNTDPGGNSEWQRYDPSDWEHPADVLIRVDPEVMPVERLSDIKRGDLLGGGEFLELIVEYCDALTAPGRDDVPDPVEPGGTESAAE